MPDALHRGDPSLHGPRPLLPIVDDDATPREAALLAELAELGRTVADAKAEMAALRADDVHFPAANDELDAVVQHTAAATNEILDACETLEQLAPSLSGEASDTVGAAVTRIYEACSFQDITGQRIAKVIAALKAIEERVQQVTRRFGTGAAATATLPAAAPDGRTEGERLANGPQKPGAASSQAQIDALLASLD